MGENLAGYGPLALFAAIFLEAMGLPMPGETALIASSVLAASGKMRFSVVFASAFLAAVLGDNLGYAVGHYAGRAFVLRHGGRFGIREEHLARVEAWIGRYGALLVFAARFIPVARQLGGVCAGTAAMPWRRFFAANALGAGIWVAWWTGLGYWLGPDAAKLLAENYSIVLHGLAAVIFVVLCAGIVGLLLRWILQLRRTGPKKERRDMTS